MTAASRIFHTLVCLQADAHRGSITNDGNQLPVIHEGFLLFHVDQLLSNPLLCVQQ